MKLDRKYPPRLVLNYLWNQWLFLTFISAKNSVLQPRTLACRTSFKSNKQTDQGNLIPADQYFLMQNTSLEFMQNCVSVLPS